MRNDIHFRQGIDEFFGVITLVGSQRDFCLWIVCRLPCIVDSRLGRFTLGEAIGRLNHWRTWARNAAEPSPVTAAVLAGVLARLGRESVALPPVVQQKAHKCALPNKAVRMVNASVGQLTGFRRNIDR